MFRNYIKTAFRILWKRRLYSAINVFGLAVALTCMVFAILYYRYEHSFDNFHKHNPNLYRINTTYTDSKTGFTEISGGTGQVQGPAFKAQLPEIISYTRVWGGDIIENVKSADKAFNLATAFVDSGFFNVFSFPMLAGDANTALNDKFSIVITETTAKKFFGTTDAIGKRLEVADNPDSLFASFIVTGVAKDPPANSSIQFDILLPFSYMKIMFDDHNWLNAYLGTFVIVHPGADIQRLQGKFTEIHNANVAAQIEEVKRAGEGNKRTFYSLQPITDIHLHPLYASPKGREGGSVNGSNPLYAYFLLGIAVFILLMASINFINLNIGNSLSRAKEIGVRKITGGSSLQVILQFLIESSIICIAALCIAIFLTQVLLPLFNQLADRQIIFSTLFDWKLCGYFIGLLVANILLAGLYPAFILARFKPAEVLYNKMSLSGKGWLGKGLVVLQFSIAICLIIGSVVYQGQMNYIRTKDLGYNPYNIIRIDIPPRRDTKSIYNIFKNELAKEPGIVQHSLEATFDNTPAYSGEKIIKTVYKTVEQTYIPMLGIKLKEGRNFSDQYGTDQTNAIIVNEAFVKAAGLKDPVGSVLNFKEYYTKKSVMIVGVVKDFHQGSLKELIRPMALTMSDHSEGTMLIRINKSRQKEALAVLEKTYALAVPGSEYVYAFWDEFNATEYTQELKWQKIITIATILSLLVCCLGLFGLTHLATHKRVKEIGVRKVLGASVRSITVLISMSYIKLIFIAILIASPIAWYILNQWLQDFAYRINITWWMLFLSAFYSIAIAIITIIFQAIKAATANPVKSLRTE